MRGLLRWPDGPERILRRRRAYGVAHARSTKTNRAENKSGPKQIGAARSRPEGTVGTGDAKSEVRADAQHGHAVEGAGAHGISLINSLTGMAVDIQTRRPKLANVFGGLTGPAIRPIALYMVHQVVRSVRIPVIGIGGIMDYRDALSLAIRKERRSFRFYAELAGAVPEKDVHDTLLELAEEEARHLVQFEMEYNRLTRKRD